MFDRLFITFCDWHKYYSLPASGFSWWCRSNDNLIWLAVINHLWFDLVFISRSKFWFTPVFTIFLLVLLNGNVIGFSLDVVFFMLCNIVLYLWWKFLLTADHLELFNSRSYTTMRHLVAIPLNCSCSTVLTICWIQLLYKLFAFCATFALVFGERFLPKRIFLFWVIVCLSSYEGAYVFVNLFYLLGNKRLGCDGRSWNRQSICCL